MNRGMAAVLVVIVLLSGFIAYDKFGHCVKIDVDCGKQSTTQTPENPKPAAVAPAGASAELLKDLSNLEGKIPALRVELERGEIYRQRTEKLEALIEQHKKERDQIRGILDAGDAADEEYRKWRDSAPLPTLDPVAAPGS